jgi:hypothetical protein
MGLLKLVAITAGRPLWMRVENLRSLILTLGRGVTSPLNKASTANGIDGNGVLDGVGGTSGVDVSIKLVGLFSGVFSGAGVWVNSREAGGVRVLNKGMDGRLLPGSRVKIMNKTPTTTKIPRLEKALCARTVFCWRVR